MPEYQVLTGDCLEKLNRENFQKAVDLTFLDPPFNQGKDYSLHDDNLSPEEYWGMMKEVCQKTFDATSKGGAVYFMQREKNAEEVLRCLRETGWTLQNLIIWKKKTSAVPVSGKYGKQYQIIAYATKGEKARVFHRLRISPPLPAHYKFQRENGVYVTDVWDDIRELTSGYFAGEEAIRNKDGERFHKQQAPIALLLRIILSSSQVGDTVLDPFAGTGTTLVTAHQVGRNSVGIEIDPKNVKMIRSRLDEIREADNVEKYYEDYKYTENLPVIWGENSEVGKVKKSAVSRQYDRNCRTADFVSQRK
jgi:DNA modification methylase